MNLTKIRWLAGCSAIALLVTVAPQKPAVPQVAPIALQASGTFQFAVARSSLSNVLTEIGRTARVTVAAPAELIAGRSAGPVTGTDTVEGALTKALDGTGFAVDQNSDGSFVVRR